MYIQNTSFEMNVHLSIDDENSTIKNYRKHVFASLYDIRDTSYIYSWGLFKDHDNRSYVFVYIPLV